MRLRQILPAALAAAGLSLAALAAATPASAASFDCAKARTADEKAICADRGLNDRDVKLAVYYDIARKVVAMGGRGAIMDRQTVWLKQRRACGADRACIRDAYDRRLVELRRPIDNAISHGPF